jgi:GDP-4-dehydro-6-deoxy-D-mannose reductase
MSPLNLDSLPSTNKEEGAKKCLVIGAAGFVGRHLLEHLAGEKDFLVHATKLSFETIDTDCCPKTEIHDLDITCESDVMLLLSALQPDIIIHLAAQSSVALSFQKPELTMNINVMGSLYVLEAIRQYCPSCKALFIGSSEQYGPVSPEQQPVQETTHPQPVSPYAISKTAVESLATLYSKSYGLHLIMARSFNHIGPAQLPIFVVSDFAKQIALIEKGQAEPVIEVGNLSAKRDFTDVRDIIRAYLCLVRLGRSGEVYNVGTGRSIAVSDVLEQMISMSGLKIEVRVDPEKFRPVDVPEFVADVTKIKKDTSWEPVIPLSDSLSDTLAYWRANV